jgi:hypothetical protein
MPSSDVNGDARSPLPFVKFTVGAFAHPYRTNLGCAI